MSDDMQFLPKRDLLTLEELDRVCAAFIRKGVRKIRITGGEPLVRRDVMGLFRSLSRHLATGRPRRADADDELARSSASSLRSSRLRRSPDQRVARLRSIRSGSAA
jgi:organic radical activating enzyme